METYKPVSADVPGLAMALRDKVTLVCRDCGEVSHFQLAGLKAESLVSCGACGLVIDPSHFRGPPALPRLPSVTPREPPAPARRGNGARVRR